MNADRQPPFAVTIARDGTHTVVTLQGELDIATEGELAAGLGLLLTEQTSLLTVDLCQLTFLDSTGLRALLTLRERCEAHACRMIVVRGAPAVQRAFDVSGLSPHFSMVDPPTVYAPAV